MKVRDARRSHANAEEKRAIGLKGLVCWDESIQPASGGIPSVDDTAHRVLIRGLAGTSQRSTCLAGAEDGQSRDESLFLLNLPCGTACTNRNRGIMATLIPESFQLIELLVWLGVGIMGAALAGLAAGLIPRKRQQSLGPGTIAGFVTAAIILLVSNPGGGRWWVVWAAIGSVMGAGAGTGAAWLFEKILDHQDRAATTR